MANNEIRKKFFDLLNERINLKVAKDYKDSLIEHSQYKYALDNNARIEFLKNQNIGDHLPTWNPFSVKGVIYKDGNCEIVESEIEELILEYGVNLANNDFGEFQNEMDQNKPFGLKSYIRLLLAVNDCM